MRLRPTAPTTASAPLVVGLVLLFAALTVVLPRQGRPS